MAADVITFAVARWRLLAARAFIAVLVAVCWLEFADPDRVGAWLRPRLGRFLARGLRRVT